MKKMKIFTLCMALFFTLTFLSCTKDASRPAQDDETKAESVIAGRISILSSGFDPQEFYVREKGTVLWINNDNSVHTVTADNGVFNSGDLRSGATFSYTFNTRGDYPYHCKYHPEMAGIIKAVEIIK